MPDERYKCTTIKSAKCGYILFCRKKGKPLDPYIKVFLSHGMILTMARETITGEIPWDWKIRDYSIVTNENLSLKEKGD